MHALHKSTLYTLTYLLAGRTDLRLHIQKCLLIRCCRPNSGILHIVGRMDRRQMQSRAGKGRQDEGGQHKFPILLVSTSSENEDTACQKIVDVDVNGMFHTDVAVTDNFSSSTVMMSACASGTGKGKGSRCRMVDVAPPGENSSDGCRPVATRVAATGQDHPDKKHYSVKIDFRRCVERHSSNVVVKPRVVAVHRTRRQVVRQK